MDIYSLSDQQILELIGAKLREHRMSKDVSQQALSAKCGLSVSTISQVENGHNISVLNVIKELRALDSLGHLERMLVPKSPTHIERHHASFHHADHHSVEEMC